MTFFRLFQGRPTRFAMFRHIQRKRPDPKSSKNEFLGTLDVSPFIVKNNEFERFGKFYKKKNTIHKHVFYQSKSSATCWDSRGSAATLTISAACAETILCAVPGGARHIYIYRE